ncbi:oxygenase MpaB family protein [Mycobacterium sp. pUA109]|uniref:oxygenase MpaB family protein n=1 Tax=Mycobacterium sp. pUA109 TaxID=3238982 RepID=UPI00351AFADC
MSVDDVIRRVNPLDAVIRLLVPLDDGPAPDLSPLWAELRRRPTAVLNPMDLFFEIQRPEYFKKARFDGPPCDPGWFGPDSAAWYVHTHTPSVVVGMINTALIDILHQDIQYAVYDHSKLVGRRPDGTVRSGTFSSSGLVVRAAHTFSFFTGVIYGSTETAESLCQTVKAMHHRVKGVRPDGKPYDADDPEFFRWTYATVVDGLAGAHERYHPKPLRGADLDQFYREYSRVGEALGGTGLPQSKAECRRVLVESPSAAEVGLNVDNSKYLQLLNPPGITPLRPVYDFAYWVIMDMMPPPVQQAVGFRQPNLLVRHGYRHLARALLNAPRMLGEIREVRAAWRRVSVAPALIPERTAS